MKKPLPVTRPPQVLLQPEPKTEPKQERKQGAVETYVKTALQELRDKDFTRMMQPKQEQPPTTFEFEKQLDDVQEPEPVTWERTLSKTEKSELPVE